MIKTGIMIGTMVEGVKETGNGKGTEIEREIDIILEMKKTMVERGIVKEKGKAESAIGETVIVGNEEVAQGAGVGIAENETVKMETTAGGVLVPVSVLVGSLRMAISRMNPKRKRKK